MDDPVDHTEQYKALHVMLDYFDRHGVDPTVLSDMVVLFAHTVRREAIASEALRQGGWRAPPDISRPKMSETYREWIPKQMRALLARLAKKLTREDHAEFLRVDAVWVRRRRRRDEGE